MGKRRKRTEFERHLVFAKTGGRCFYCWDELDFIWDFVCDHYVPLSRGGRDDHSNLVPACTFCDNRKKCHLPTPQVCAFLKKWKHEGLPTAKFRIEMPIPEANSDRSKKNRRAIARASAKLTGFIPNPVLPWNILGDHTTKLYGERRVDSSIETRIAGDQEGVTGGDTARGLYEGGAIDLSGSAAQQGFNGCGGAA